MPLKAIPCLLSPEDVITTQAIETCQETLSPVHTGDKVHCRRYDRLCCRFWRQIGNNLNSTACRGRHCRQLGRICRQYGRLCRPNVERPFDFVESVYGPKRHGRLCRFSTKSTVLNSTLSPLCTGLYVAHEVEATHLHLHTCIIVIIINTCATILFKIPGAI